jgi:DNA-binding response OmpR family regulator
MLQPWHTFLNAYKTNHILYMNTKTAKAAPKKVLIIEDEGDLCLLLNILLDGKGMEVEHVQSLAKAEEFLQQEQPSLVLLDNRLPDGFGVDFISVIKDQHPSTKIIMISGVDAAACDVALENGADVFLKKPFTRAELYKSVNDVLNEKQPA